MSSATSQACAPAAAVGETQATAVGAVAVSSPTIFQYPQQPARDDGRMLALASIIGGVIDAVLGGDGVDDAKSAEANWKAVLDGVLKPRGEALMARFDTEIAKLPNLETDLLNQLADYRTKADIIWPKLDPLDQQLLAEITEQRQKNSDEFALADTLCTADAMTKLCQFVACGYSPDYTGIATRARADVELASQSAFEQACRIGNRYNTRRMNHTLQTIRMGTMSAGIGAVAAAREKERMFAFETNYKLRFELAKAMEQFRIDRKRLAMEYDRLAIQMLTERWNAMSKLYLDLEGRADGQAQWLWRAFFEHAYKALREGGEMLAAAAQAYQFLAASIRATAKQGSGGGVAGALATLAVILPVFSGKCGDTGIFGIMGRPEMCCGTTGSGTGG